MPILLFALTIVTATTTVQGQSSNRGSPERGEVIQYARIVFDEARSQGVNAYRLELSGEAGTYPVDGVVTISLRAEFPDVFLDYALEVGRKFGFEQTKLFVQPTFRSSTLPFEGAYEPLELERKVATWNLDQGLPSEPGVHQIEVSLALLVWADGVLVPRPEDKLGSLILQQFQRKIEVVAQADSAGESNVPPLIKGPEQTNENESERTTEPEPRLQWWRDNIAGLSIVVVFFLAFAAYLSRVFTRPETPPESAKGSPDAQGYSVAEIGVSDASLNSPKEDLIGTSRLAKGLSLFLSHDKTEAPLTLAITGPWGSGKSSIMGMLKSYLSDARYRPVWFNVWHHQDEEHFFGALLENIRNEAIPPLWHFSGIFFRLRLMAIRLKRRPLMLVSLGVLLLLAIFPDPLLSVLALENLKDNIQVVSALLAGFTLLDQYSAFGFSGKDLTKSLVSSFKTINFEADAGLRYRVRQCLQDIDRALGDRAMIIFVDDLDRCQPEHVMKVLEIVNFLSSPPLRFFIVFGISLERVIPIISPCFAQQVEETFPPEPGQDEEVRNKFTHFERFKLARQYLRKMINMEVSVPIAPVEELLKLASRNPEHNLPVHTDKDEANRRVRMLDQRVFPTSMAALIAGFLALGPTGGLDYLQSLNATPEFGVAEEVAAINPGNESNAATENIGNRLNANDSANTSREAGNSKPATGTKSYRVTSDDLMPFVTMAVVAVGVVGAFMRREKQRAQIEDSNAFLDALGIWAPVLNARDPTPRHYIRMINQLRLLSMRMRLECDVKERLDGESNAEPVTRKDSDSDELTDEDRKMIYVTVLSAFHELEIDAPEFLDRVASINPESGDLQSFFAELSLSNWSPIERERAHAALLTSIKRHAEKFPDIWPDATDIGDFQNMMRGVQLS